jgi:diguanylate cyclase (GGDEF)-like protein
MESISRVSAEILSSLLGQASHGVVAVGRDDSVLLVNGAALDLLKLDQLPKQRMTWSRVRAATNFCASPGMPLPEDMDPVYEAVRNEKRMECNLLVKPSDSGHGRWLHVAAFPATDRGGNFIAGIATLFDISEFKGIQDMLYHKATHDPLTGLSNKAFFSASLCKELARSKRRDDAACALLVLDIDKFKRVNDSLGHAAGDDLLVKVADRINSEVRDADVVARIGGDEFAILLTDLSVDNCAQTAREVSERICLSLTNAFQIKDEEVYISASIGISLYPFDGQNEGVMLAKADSAMYMTKEHGRNGWRLWEECTEAGR